MATATSEGLAALPRRWRLALTGLGLAAAIWLYARSRRLGSPEDEARPLPPPRWAYIDAVAGTLARTRRPQEAAEPVRRRARELIARRTGLPPDAGPEELYQAAVRLGLPPDEAAAALGSPGPTEEATRVGRRPGPRPSDRRRTHDDTQHDAVTGRRAR